MATLLLDYQREMLTELLAEDGLLVVGKGLGMHQMVMTLIKIHAHPSNLVLLIHTTPEECQQYMHAMRDLGVPAKTTLRTINNETFATERAALYKAGGVLVVTSRILVVDMLNEVLPVHSITGFIVANAHRVSEGSSESFILRLFRQRNKTGFIKAFSDMPEVLSQGFARLEKTLKYLYLRRVYFWPRFQVTVARSLEKHHIDVIELKCQLTPKMKRIQHAIIEVMDACLLEIRRLNPSMDLDEMNVENALFKNFEQLVRIQLDPVWHRVSVKTKSLVSDLKMLRKLLIYLLQYDCVTFHSFLSTLLATQFASQSSSLARTADQASPWLLMEAATIVIQTAKDRVYSRTENPVRLSELDAMYGACPVPQGGWHAGRYHLPRGIDPICEEQPKWRLVKDVLMEIEEEWKVSAQAHEEQEHEERRRAAAAAFIAVNSDEATVQTTTSSSKEGTIGPVLIMCSDQRTVTQLREYLTTSLAPDVAPSTISQQQQPSGTEQGEKPVHPMLYRALQNHFRWKVALPTLRSTLSREETEAEKRREAERAAIPKANGQRQYRPSHSGASSSSSSTFRGGPNNKRRRTRGAAVSAGMGAHAASDAPAELSERQLDAEVASLAQ